LFSAAQVLGSETLSQTVTQGDTGEKQLRVGASACPIIKTAQTAFNAFTAVDVFLQKERSHLCDSITYNF